MKVLLFDMDGVLVNVAASYRLAIKYTTQQFVGKEISLKQTQAYKNRGGCNNDWDLTEQIILDHGNRVHKKRIVDVFQHYYLGNNFDGLIKNEKWLLDRAILSDLYKRLPLGIVTGRPRQEAIFVLQRFEKIRIILPRKSYYLNTELHSVAVRLGK